MARKKVKLQYIVSDSARRATLKKRRASLMKKTRELATLCDVDACIVVYGQGESQAQVWPPSAAEVARILGRFKDAPELEQSKKTLDMEGFLRQHIAKLKDQLEKARRDNHTRETTLLLHNVFAGRGLTGLSVEQLISLESTVNARLEAVANRIQLLREQGHGDPATTLQLSMTSQLNDSLVVPYTANDMMVQAAESDPSGCWPLLNQTNAGGENLSFFGGDVAAGASTSGGLSDMFKHLDNNTIAGYPWTDKEPSFPPM